MKKALKRKPQRCNRSYMPKETKETKEDRERRMDVARAAMVTAFMNVRRKEELDKLLAEVAATINVDK